MIGNRGNNTAESGKIPLRVCYPIPEAAILLGGVGERTVWYLVETGQIDSVKVGRRRLIPHDAITEYMARLRDDHQKARAAATGAA